MKASCVDVATAAWQPECPAWVLQLAEACDASGKAAVARRLRYSDAVVGEVIRHKYTGSYAAVERAVHGVFANATVPCPVLGDILEHACLEHQRKPFAATNRARVTLYRACRNGCAHSRIAPSGTAARVPAPNASEA